ncbi:hypothetical protein BJV82DRAFT_544334 [Fennellomyces sp. T-0311]|nr:hypothetical protein BJV82DRAFT_544334 [Fennellomyces sp. T-0311]
MYSPSQIHVASQQPFDPAAAVAANAGDCGLSTLNLGNAACLYPQPQDSYDYMRRFSYAELLSNQSEASLSDTEQQTPSPSNDYEEYVYLQQQHQPHPLEEKQRTEAYSGSYSSMDSVPYYSPAWFSSAAMDLNGGGMPPRSLLMTTPNQSQLNYCLPSSTHLTAPAMFDYHHPLSPSYMVDASALTAAPTAVMPVDDASFRERSSSSSASSDCSTSASTPPQQSEPATTTTAGGKAKQTRSRGRRVSSNPGAAGQKMFTCRHDDCGKVFKRSEHLKRHIRSIHTLEKPFECPYHSCSKRFSRSDNLNQHIRIHRHTTKDKSNGSAATNTTSSAGSSSPRNNSFSNYMQNFL